MMETIIQYPRQYQLTVSRWRLIINALCYSYGVVNTDEGWIITHQKMDINHYPWIKVDFSIN